MKDEFAQVGSVLLGEYDSPLEGDELLTVDRDRCVTVSLVMGVVDPLQPLDRVDQ